MKKYKEIFRPLPIVPPDTFTNKVLFCLRLLIDLQNNTIYMELSKRMRHYRGKVLDVGCGLSPYRHLLDSGKTEYFGLDIKDSSKFNCKNTSVTHYDGMNFPFKNAAFNHVICTEVLEHIIEPSIFISEVHRVLKKGGEAVFTIPWSARNHFKPYDYHRYTPSMLKMLFGRFESVTIHPRGSDIASVSGKIVAMTASNVFQIRRMLIFAPVTILMLPVALSSILIGHLSLLLGIGSKDDPLGYTIIAHK